MPNYHYEARTKAGEAQNGIIAAGSERAALMLLVQHDLIVTAITEERESALWAVVRRFSFWQRIKQKHVVIFSRQLAVLFDAGVPLVEALRTLQQEAETPRLGEVIFSVAEDVNGGLSFSEAIEKHPAAFSTFFVMMIRSGEVSGRLQESLIFLADYLEREYALSAKVKKSFMYPGFIFFSFIMVALFLLIFVVPNLAKVFSDTGQSLPLATRLLIGLSNALRSYGLAVIAVMIIGGVIGGRRLVKTVRGRSLWDWAKLHIPIFGGLFQRIYLTRLAENLGTLMAGGISMTQALEISADVVGNVHYRSLLLDALEGVKRGEPLSARLSHSPLIPRVIGAMVAIGEKTGKVDVIFKTVARFYQRELDTMIEGLVSLIEPLLIAVLGGGVGVLVASILLPIYRLSIGI
ncbi:MAG: type II secretion system F family protein [bacterium]|nr:type II secretion system F family protein [bacterium]MDZ4296268.1 type II secretion system F family protein [Patescibacteria group bacterium]MDZ4296285.1 type II secretion system F family protein [Patescibacteria group bacterium]